MRDREKVYIWKKERSDEGLFSSGLFCRIVISLADTQPYVSFSGISPTAALYVGVGPGCLFHIVHKTRPWLEALTDRLYPDTSHIAVV